jgi:hypothetical protein
MEFETGNTLGRGRPRGSRNKLDAFAYACALAHVQHKRADPPPEEYSHTNLWRALEVALRESPRDYVTKIISMLPKQLSVETTQLTELQDDELDRMIDMLRKRALAAHEERAIEETRFKVIEHAQ